MILVRIFYKISRRHNNFPPLLPAITNYIPPVDYSYRLSRFSSTISNHLFLGLFAIDFLAIAALIILTSLLRIAFSSYYSLICLMKYFFTDRTLISFMRDLLNFLLHILDTLSNSGPHIRQILFL